MQPTGGKLWRLKYRFGGKEKLLALGAYAELSLKEARRQRDLAREKLYNGQDPGELRKLAKVAQRTAVGGTYEAVARACVQRQSG